MVKKLKRRMLPRRSSTGNMNCIDISYSTVTTTNSGNSSVITNEMSVTDDFQKERISDVHRRAGGNGSSHKQQQRQQQAKITRNKLTRRPRRRHTMDHIDRDDDDVEHSGDNPMSLGSLLRFGSENTCGLTENEDYDLVNNTYPCPTPPTAFESVTITSKPLKSTTTTTTTTKKMRTRFHRRSSLARAASSIVTTFETSRHWFSTSITINSNTATSPKVLQHTENISNVKDENKFAANLQLQFDSEQKQLQHLAREMHREGHFHRAIMYWEKSLELGERNRDFSSLSSLTEIRCMLLRLHFQESKRLNQEPQNETTDNPRGSPSSCDESLVADLSQHSLSLEEVVNSTSFDFQEKQKRQLPASSENGNAATYHRQEAQQYINGIKPVMVQPGWLRYDHSLMNFLCEAKAWELALVVAKGLSEKSLSDQLTVEEEEEFEKGQRPEEPPIVKLVDPHMLAVIHFHVASLKLKRHKQGEALQHLQMTVQRFQEVSADQRDTNMYINALQLLATEYQAQGKSNLALKTFRNLQNHASSEQYARISSRMAEIYIADGQLDMALKELESTYDQYEKNSNACGDRSNSNPSTKNTIRSQLLQLKGDVYCRLGRMDESLEVYQQAFEEAQYPPDKAKLLYIMGRLYNRMGRTHDAISCFEQEMKVTQVELGANHVSLCVIYHELAKLYDEGLGLHKIAMKKYKKALEIELSVMDDLRSTVVSCNKCADISSNRICDKHANIHSQVQGQIRETKNCIGRLHYKLGDLKGAMKTGLSSDPF